MRILPYASILLLGIGFASAIEYSNSINPSRNVTILPQLENQFELACKDKHGTYKSSELLDNIKFNDINLEIKYRFESCAFSETQISKISKRYVYCKNSYGFPEEIANLPDQEIIANFQDINFLQGLEERIQLPNYCRSSFR